MLYVLVDTPCNIPGSMGRSHSDIYVIPAHEAFSEFAEANADHLRQCIQAQKANGTLPQCYWDHPVVKEHPDEDVLYGGLFVDGVAHALTDGVIGFWLICFLTGRRFLLSVLRKRRLCGSSGTCGCRGWCTLYCIFEYLAWCFTALKNGAYPSERHDRKRWRPLDVIRAARAGALMPFRFAMTYLKTDWSELATTFGFPGHNDGLRPCFKCNCHEGNMHEIAGCSPMGLIWRENMVGDYESACNRCEINIRITHDEHAAICNALTDFDKRSIGALGRALARDVLVGGVQLLKGDRLEPCPSVPDTGPCFDALDAACFPLWVLFWRRSMETIVRRRSPLFQQSTGIAAELVLTVDILHALYLGIMQALVKHVIWFLIDAHMWGEHGTQEEIYKVNLSALAAHLESWYSKRHQEFPKEGLTRVHDLNSKVVGEPGARKLASKAAQTYGLLLFCVYILTSCANRLPSGSLHLCEACEAMVHMIHVLRHAGQRPTRASQQQCFDCLHRIYARTEHLEEMLVGKRHMVVHMIYDMARLGNPDMYANWYDESLSKMLKGYLRHVSQSTFEPFVLLRMRDGLRQEGERVKEKRSRTTEG